MSNFSRRKAISLGAAGAVGVAGAATAFTQSKDSETVEPTTVAQSSDSGMLEGKVALVTGAARGIGRAIAVSLAQAGADIAAVDILQNIQGLDVPMSGSTEMNQTKQQIEQAGKRCLAITADIRDLAALQNAVAQTTQELGAIDILVANAGVNSNAGFNTDDEAAWIDHWNIITDVNVRGTANTLRAVVPSMVERQTGNIIITSSTFGRQGNDTNPAYVTSKWGQIGLTKAAAIELGEYNITVNA